LASIPACPRDARSGADPEICLDGQITYFLSSPVCKNISSLRPTQITSLIPAVPSHPKGRLAIVTDAGRDAVDVDVPITNGAEADGEDVWS
jgi:hypothetical protein